MFLFQKSTEEASESSPSDQEEEKEPAKEGKHQVSELLFIETYWHYFSFILGAEENFGGDLRIIKG